MSEVDRIIFVYSYMSIILNFSQCLSHSIIPALRRFAGFFAAIQ